MAVSAAHAVSIVRTSDRSSDAARIRVRVSRVTNTIAGRNRVNDPRSRLRFRFRAKEGSFDMKRGDAAPGSPDTGVREEMRLREDDAPRLTAYRLSSMPAMRIVPAARERAWMDATGERFAYRCLPLDIANQSGWWVLNSHDLTVSWDGGGSVDALRLEWRSGEPPFPAISHFGDGIITWHLPFLFRTPPGWNLLVRGPANLPKPGISALEGVVESDWAVATFTMNWKLTAVDQPVAFEAGEPVCQLIPQRRGDLEAFAPEIRDIGSSPELEASFSAWSASRSRFLGELNEPDSEAVRRKWQKDYFHGAAPDGTRGPAHQTRLRLREFEDSEHIFAEEAPDSDRRSGNGPRG